MGSYTLKSLHRPAPDSARSADSSNMAAVTPPILHSSLDPSHLAQIEIHTPPSQLNSLCAFSFTSLSLSPIRAHSLPFSSAPASHCYLILSVPFSLSYPSSIPPQNPTGMRLFSTTLF
ncbi:hypothetical protein EI94DRAFT_1717218 [Lactarius quietus]|nr:hypothetical protein EI94DRAFT_1717218 [Lactarius quietus]